MTDGPRRLAWDEPAPADLYDHTRPEEPPAMTTTATIRVDEVEVGARILYPHQQRNTAPIDQPVTVSGIIEYPATRVLYFAEGGYGVADRHVTLPLAEHVTEVQARRATPGIICILCRELGLGHDGDHIVPQVQ